MPAESQREEQSGPGLCNFTTSEIWLVDATDSGLEEEEEEMEFPSETRFLLRLGRLLSLAGGRKGCCRWVPGPLCLGLLTPPGEGLALRFEVPFSALKAPDPPAAEARLSSLLP